MDDGQAGSLHPQEKLPAQEENDPVPAFLSLLKRVIGNPSFFPSSFAFWSQSDGRV